MKFFIIPRRSLCCTSIPFCFFCIMVSKHRRVLLLVALNVLLTSLLIWTHLFSEPDLINEQLVLHSKWVNSSSPDLNLFTDSDNETGYPDYIVPNLIHFIRLNETNITFVEMICIKSAYLNHRPDQIIIHCDNCSFHGRYWDHIKDLPNLIVQRVVPPDQIFGRKFGNIWHRSDILRILTLMRFGGIFLDNDVYVVKSLNPFRKFEMTLGWDYEKFLGNQILIAHANARFLKLYYSTYVQYRPKIWYYNGGELPTRAILYKHPELVHRVPMKFGVHTWVVYDLFNKYWPKWTEQYCIHLFIRHREDDGPKEFDEYNIQTLNNTFAEMAKLVYYAHPTKLNSNTTKKVANTKSEHNTQQHL